MTFFFAVGVAVGLAILGMIRFSIIEPRGRWIIAVLSFPGSSRIFAAYQQKMLMEWYVGFMLKVWLPWSPRGLLGFLPARFPLQMGGADIGGRPVSGLRGAFASRAGVFIDEWRGTLSESVLATRRPWIPMPGEPRDHHGGNRSRPTFMIPGAESRDGGRIRGTHEGGGRERAPLYVNNGFPTALKIDFPGVFALWKTGRFSNRWLIFPVLTSCSIAPWCYRPGGLERADLARYGH